MCQRERGPLLYTLSRGKIKLAVVITELRSNRISKASKGDFVENSPCSVR